jgi:hypothetical protein
MISALKRRLQVSYGAFTGVRSTRIAQLLIVALLGAVTVVGMSDVAKHEDNTTNADWMR